MVEDWLTTNFPFIVSVGTLAAFITALAMMFAYTKGVSKVIGKRIVVNVTNDPNFKKSIEGVVTGIVNPVNEKLTDIKLEIELIKTNQSNTCQSIDDLKDKSDDQTNYLAKIEHKVDGHLVESAGIHGKQQTEINALKDSISTIKNDIIQDLRSQISRLWDFMNMRK